MPTKLDSLPNDCLVDIFIRLPIIDLIHSAKVCTRWVVIRNEVYRRLTCLTIRVSPRRLHHYGPNEDEFLRKFGNDRMEQNQLAFCELTAPIVTTLLQLFPHIRYLAISMNVVGLDAIRRTVDAFDVLIAGFNRLRFLTVFMYPIIPDRVRGEIGLVPFLLPRQNIMAPYITKIIHRINSLVSLRKLAFFFENIENHWEPMSEIDYDLSIVSQLEELYFSAGTTIRPMIEALRRHALPNGLLRVIEIDDQVTDNDLYNLVQIPVPVQSRITFLRLELFNRGHHNNPNFEAALPFERLTSLAFHTQNESFDLMMNKFATHFRNLSHFELISCLNTFQCTQFNPFVSVRSLCIQIAETYPFLNRRDPDTDHHHIPEGIFALAFPNVEKIKLRLASYSCTTHGVEERLECAREQCRPFLQFRQMTEISVQLGVTDFFTFGRDDL